MNDLDTEIRRAMGELAEAAPPARDPESFRRDLDMGPAPAAAGASRWLLVAAATVGVIALVGGILAIAVSDDSATTVTPTPDTESAPTALAGDALLETLAGRRWVALERFDDPSPTARAPEFTVTTTASGAVIDGFDGCNTYGGAFVLDGTITAAGEVSSTTIACDVETLIVSGSIELFPDGATLLLTDVDGSPIARFHDLEELSPASADDMPYTFFGDDLAAVGFGVSGDGRGGCARVGWEESSEGVRVELLEIIGDCSPDDRLGGWLASVTDPAADAFVTPDGILLADSSSTLHLRRLPVVEPDPDGVTLSAGAIFAIGPGLGTGPDDVLAEVVPRLGEPDVDTGWLPAERNVADDNTVTLLTPCPELTEYRELHWGDLSFAFWGTGARSLLQYWNVGDGLAIGFEVPETGLPTAGPPTGLLTEDSVGVGDPVTAIPDRFDTSDREELFGLEPADEVARITVLSSNPAFSPGSVASPTRGGEYTVIDDVIVGFGAQTFGC